MKKLCAAALLLLLLFLAPAWAREDLLTVSVDGAPCRLGLTTAREIADRGWPCDVEADGVFAFYSEENGSYFYVRTADGTADAPIVYIDLMWADGVPAVYCGYAADGEEASGDDISLWKWLEKSYGASPNEEGALVARVPQADGGVLQIETDGSRVRLSLLK